MRRLLLALALLLLAVPACAQGPVQTQQALLRLDAASNLCTASSATPTCSITVPSGQWVYITAIEITLVCGTTTCTAAAAQTTSTANLGGVVFTVPSTGYGAVAGSGAVMYFPFANPVKSAAPGTTTSIGALPAVTNGTWRVNVWGYFSAQ